MIVFNHSGAQIVSDMASGRPSSWLLYPSDTPLIVWSISLLSGIKKCSRLVQLSGSVNLWAGTSGGHVLSDSHPWTFRGPPRKAAGSGPCQSQQCYVGGAPCLIFSLQCPFPTSVCPPLISFMRSLQIGPATWCWRADLGWLSFIWTQDKNRVLGCLLSTVGPWTSARVWPWTSALTCPRFDLQHVGLASPCRGFLRPLLCNQLVELHSVREQPPTRLPSLLTLVASFGGAHKITLRFDHSVEGLTEFTKIVTFTVMVYYRERIQIKISEGKRHVGQGPGGVQMQSSGLPVESRTTQPPPSHNVWQFTERLLTRETHLSLQCLKFLLGLKHLLPTWLTFSLQPSWKLG